MMWTNDRTNDKETVRKARIHVHLNSFQFVEMLPFHRRQPKNMKNKRRKNEIQILRTSAHISQNSHFIVTISVTQWIRYRFLVCTTGNGIFFQCWFVRYIILHTFSVFGFDICKVLSTKIEKLNMCCCARCSFFISWKFANQKMTLKRSGVRLMHDIIVFVRQAKRKWMRGKSQNGTYEGKFTYWYWKSVCWKPYVIWILRNQYLIF